MFVCVCVSMIERKRERLEQIDRGNSDEEEVGGCEILTYCRILYKVVYHWTVFNC